MKKYCITILALVLSVTVMTGCGKTSSDNQQKAPEFEVNKINVDLKLKEEEQGVLSYSDGKKMVFRIEAPNEIDYMTRWIPERFVVYDIADQKIDREYALDEGVFGKSAIPYKDGLLYSCYRVNRKNQQPYHWQILYQVGTKKKLVDQGETGSNYQESLLVEDGAVYYTFKDRTDDYHCGVRKLKDGKTAAVVECDNMYAVDLLKVNSGVCYTRMWNDESMEFSAANGKEILWEQKFELNGGNLATGINDKYILYYELGPKENRLTAIDLESGKKTVTDMELKEPSITGIGDYFLIEDENMNQYYTKIDEAITVEKLVLPEEQKYKMPLGYGISAGKDSAILISGDSWDEKMEYYLLKLK